jgi:hypothetical protein
MFGLFAQGRDGFAWISSHTTIEAALTAMAEQESIVKDDFLMVLPIVGFRDLDGERAE